MRERRRGGEGDGLSSEEEGNRRDRQLDSEEESSANTMADRRLSLHSELYVQSPDWKPAKLAHTGAEDITSICLGGKKQKQKKTQRHVYIRDMHTERQCKTVKLNIMIFIQTFIWSNKLY